MKLALLALLVCALLACGQVTCDRVTETEQGQTSTAGAGIGVRQLGAKSLEERIANHPTVVRARLTSVSAEVVAGAERLQGSFFVVLKFNLSVSEYLKGSGGNDITAIRVVTRESLSQESFDTRKKAEDAISRIRDKRDTQWDDRDAIFFLKNVRENTFPSLRGENRYFIGHPHTLDNYSIASRFEKAWLPAAPSSSAATGDSQEFLLDAPSLSGFGSTTPTNTLGNLKQRIAEVTAELNGGDGSEAYKECVKFRYQIEREDSYREATGYPGGKNYRVQTSYEFGSGQPAGTLLYEDELGGAYSAEKKAELRIDGLDSILFSTVLGDIVPDDYDGDGQNDSFYFEQSVVASRPLPTGEYQFNRHFTPLPFLACNHTLTDELSVVVGAPDGTLHELFFDPVTVGSGVAADATNGVLKPASFTDANGSSATLGGISYESSSTVSGQAGTVKVEVTPDDALTGQIVDIIELDGTVSLSLDVADATVDAANDTLSWSVSSEPWEDGDQLMVRIRRVPPSCSNSSAVSNPSTESALVGDCETLLELKDDLAVTATLNWGFDTVIESWDGVTVGGTPRRVTELGLQNRRLTGVVPEGLGELTGLERLDLRVNALRGAIPSRLGELTDLEILDLSVNRLTGTIPPELGRLSELVDLALYGNPDLTGSIPSELGRLSKLELLRLSSSDLRGEIPVELGDLSELTWLWLHGNRLSGGIPIEFGELTNLEMLKVYDNELSGSIPWELGELSELRTLDLSDNDFVGCIRPSLRLVNDNDLAYLGLPDCTESGRVPAPSVVSASVSEGTFTITWSAVTGASRYEAQHRVSGSDEDWTGLPSTESTSATYRPEGGPLCRTTYEFRVRSYGDGTTYVAGWSAESEPEPVDMDACNRDPVFDAATYEFSVREDASTGHVVGALSATDPDEGDTVTFTITSGNDDGKFAIGAGTGEITVAGVLDHESVSLFTLTVEASDGNGGTPEATVRIMVSSAMCSGGVAVPDPGSNPGLVMDCETLLGLMDALVGNRTLNWSFRVAMTSWDGVTVGGTPSRVRELDLQRRELTGIIPAGLRELAGMRRLDLSSNQLREGIPSELGDLSNLRELDLSYNLLMGEIPTELGSLTNLNALRLHENQLSEGIPPELGRLSNLEWLILSGNELTGPIPRELGSVPRLAHLWLQDNQLSGEIPSELGGLRSMQILRLHNNQLSGSIPWQLGNIEDLLILHVSGNMLEGCVPPALREVGTNDFATLGLPYCAQEGPVPAPSGVSVTLSGGTFTITWSAVDGAGLHEVQHRTGGSEEEWTSLPTTEGTSTTYGPEGGPACETTYEFRVRAYGDGTTYTAVWGAGSEPEPVTTGSCNGDPVFDPSSYDFSVREDAFTGDTVGTVSASDPDEGDTVTYAITSGNDDGKFAIGAGTGEITVAGTLDHESVSSYTLTVEASDGNGGTATATVVITVIEASCTNGIAVPGPDDNPGLVSDCTVLLGMRDTLAGDATLDWSPFTAMSDWYGVTMEGTPLRVTWLLMPSYGLNGSIPPEIGQLSNLQYLLLGNNRLTGGIPSELGDLASLQLLTLASNLLSGEIPEELGQLTGLRQLILSGNGLEGEIPAELGQLSELRLLWLDGNELTGEIPQELGLLTNLHQLQLQRNLLTGAIPWDLGGLSELEIVHLSTNQLVGCVPPALRSVEDHDMDNLGLSDCAEDGPAPAPEGLSVSLTDDTFSLSWSEVTGASEYEVQYRTGGSEDEWNSVEITTATVLAFTPEDGAVCGTTYEFRVRSYGDAATYAAGWGPGSEAVSVTTGACGTTSSRAVPTRAGPDAVALTLSGHRPQT